MMKFMLFYVIYSGVVSSLLVMVFLFIDEKIEKKNIKITLMIVVNILALFLYTPFITTVVEFEEPDSWLDVVLFMLFSSVPMAICTTFPSAGVYYLLRKEKSYFLSALGGFSAGSIISAVVMVLLFMLIAVR